MRHRFALYGKTFGLTRPIVNSSRDGLLKPRKDKDVMRKIRNAYVNSGGKHFGDKMLALVVISARPVPDARETVRYVSESLEKLAYMSESQVICPIVVTDMKEDHDHVEVIITDDITESMMKLRVKGGTQ